MSGTPSAAGNLGDDIVNTGRLPPIRHGAGYRRGAVSAPHFETVGVGQAILRAGGNAIEAMVAMAASIAAVYPHMNHIGGDGFWLIREPSGQVRALIGAGPAGANATIDFYRDHGHENILARGPLAALTVPGAVGTWVLALELAKTLGGKLPLDLLLSPAAQQAREATGLRAARHRSPATKSTSWLTGRVFCADVPHKWRGAGCRNKPETDCARRNFGATIARRT